MRFTGLFVAWAALAGCATDYVHRTRNVRAAYESYQHERALKLLEPELKEEGGTDRLLALLDKGMVLHAAGRWAESIEVLAEADKLAESLDVVSVSEEATTLLANERHRHYRGEDFERLMISTLQALNYAQLGKDEEALVEVRRVNERLRKMVADEKKPYEQLAVARYIGGVLYEDQREEDSAFIDYAEAERLSGRLGHLAEPLLRLAQKTGREDQYRALLQKYPDVPHPPMGPNEGQVVVVVEAGLSPQKQPDHRQFKKKGTVELVTIPAFRERGKPPRVQVSFGASAVAAVTVTSLSEVAQLHLEDRIGRIFARQLATTAVKAGVAAGVGALTKREELGVLTFWLLVLANQPDLRSWLSLPAEFQIARARLPAGKHQVVIDASGKRSVHEVDVKPGRVALLVVRRY